MKLFKQLLVAPAALGLLAPVAATAAELNLDGVNKYASEEQVTSISQFSDVKPTDWAYQALSNLIERYGCVAGYPDGTYKGARAMTRFEAAALLNACLDRVTEVTDELKKLMAEFEKELAILKGRVDGLEAKVGELEANQFSTTTKLKGLATFVVGGASNTGFGDEVTFNYDVRLTFDTSFTGKDLLRTTLRSGNFANSAFGNGNTTLEVAFQEETGGRGTTSGQDTVGINRLFYQFPVGDGLTATFGAKVRQDDMLAMWPSVYPSDTILDLFTFAGARGTYSLNLGAGVGVSYQKDGFSISTNFVSNEAAAESSQIGVGEAYTFTTQVGYAGKNFGAALAYTYSDFADFGQIDGVYSNNMGLSAYWQPSEASWVPSISAGFGYGTSSASLLDDNWSWMVGLQWADAFVKGNSLGMAIGSAGQAALGAGQGTGGLWFDNGEDTIAYELFYKFQVTDNISVTPAFFYIENTGVSDTVGGLLKTTFKF
ncbi:carbohydrate porin [Cyanobium sp. T1G-Tous]|uniref:iron uptake porin n=1 Tax=unclassified Cyanobium TaxID=2627006 RepID=UPI0020CDE118|nr:MULTISPECIES: iron uptake porin [unclassified Cyanobium]MCP9779068.1 carbohydrate porin [Cyanobium sp. Tous-M-B4]MCP9803016.1 carbohydrate porin [Cyanobium sp. T1G-Tous]MCP9876903.1 carbohydrate porin [Cyanobium sp. A2C-AMD]